MDALIKNRNRKLTPKWDVMLGYNYAEVPMPDDQLLFSTLAPAVTEQNIQARIRGNLVMLVGGTFLYVFTLLSLGLLISSRAQNQNGAIQMSLTIMLPTIFFSDFIFPRETMPWIFYVLLNLNWRYEHRIVSSGGKNGATP